MNVETIDFISQAWMVIFEYAAIWLLGRREDWRGGITFCKADSPL